MDMITSASTKTSKFVAKGLICEAIDKLSKNSMLFAFIQSVLAIGFHHFDLTDQYKSVTAEYHTLVNINPDLWLLDNVKKSVKLYTWYLR